MRACVCVLRMLRTDWQPCRSRRRAAQASTSLAPLGLPGPQSSGQRARRLHGRRRRPSPGHTRPHVAACSASRPSGHGEPAAAYLATLRRCEQLFQLIQTRGSQSANDVSMTASLWMASPPTGGKAHRAASSSALSQRPPPPLPPHPPRLPAPRGRRRRNIPSQLAAGSQSLPGGGEGADP